jgi:hypothetical protein
MTPLTVSNALVLSFVVFFLSIECVFSQTLDQEIAALPTCSTTCLTKAAANVNCGAGDFICQCQHQDGIVGVLGRVSSQVTCLIGDCGISNATSEWRLPFEFHQIHAESDHSNTSTVQKDMFHPRPDFFVDDDDGYFCIDIVEHLFSRPSSGHEHE